MKYIKFLSLFLVMHAINTNAMDRLLVKRYDAKQRSHRPNKLVLVPTKSENQVKKIVLHKKDLVCYLHQGTFHPTFTKEIDKNILRFIGTNTRGDTLQEAAQIFSALICVNKFTWMHMDNDQRTLGWIKDLSKRFDCINIDVAKALRTRAAKQRRTAQLGLLFNFDLPKISKNISNFEDCALDINFSYDKEYPSPLLQCCGDAHRKYSAAHWLIESGADINVCTSSGDNACTLALSLGHTRFMKAFIERKDFIPNHQNNKGDTALHYYVGHIKRLSECEGDYNDDDRCYRICVMEKPDATIQGLLKKGANPILVNEAGETPLMIARMIKVDKIKETVVELLEQAAIKFDS